MLLDSCFLIDLHRERRTNDNGAACRFLAANAKETFSISAVAAMEFCEGFADEDLWRTIGFLDLFQQIPVDDRVAFRSSRIRRALRQTGQLLPDGDILIAASALEWEETLVTNNVAHFSRIKDLVIIDYISTAV